MKRFSAPDPEPDTLSETVTAVRDYQSDFNLDNQTLDPTPDDLEDKLKTSNTSFHGDEFEDEDAAEMQELWDELAQILIDCKHAESQNTFICKELVRYFKMNRMDRAVEQVEGDLIAQMEGERMYMNLLHSYQGELNYKDEVFGNSELKLIIAQDESEKSKKKFEELFQAFEEKLKEIGVTLIGAKTGSYLSERAVKRILRKHRNSRLILMEVRKNYKMLEKRNEGMEEKSKEIEDLGNGFKMKDFTQLRIEITNLAEKIEDRNSEMDRSRQRCQTNTQHLAHFREKSHLLTDVVKNRTEELKKTEQVQTEERHNLGKLKMDLIQRRNDYQNLIDSSGLLTHKILLKHYDDTEKFLQESEVVKGSGNVNE